MIKNKEASFDEIIDNLLETLQPLKGEAQVSKQISILNQLRQRLFSGEIHIAIIGQFNRGKSSFINKLVKKDILPTSVLPLTAIPTEIRYGEETKAIIDFEDGAKIEAAEEYGVKAILSDFVTENSNPENRAGVSKAVVYCKSEFLSGSTIIIDTPGFGSTHIHNTKATLDILPSCDAVFFMLSADLPITQIELNFMKQIIPQSSRIFFVYNKIDLLSDDDLKTTSEFITATIKERLGKNIANWFLAVSAKTDQGMDVISNEVLGFLRKEKFFSLSQAIERKLMLAVDEIKKYTDALTVILDNEIAETRNSMDELKKEFAANDVFIKNYDNLKTQWANLPFIMSRTEKIKRISDDITDIEIFSKLLKGNTNIFEEKHSEFAQKNAKIYKGLTKLSRKLNEIEIGQAPARETLENIQRCINLYIQ
ncbi:MAG: dynamin family protein [Chitinivibrionia bacterium]|nr:dynamin family protein [Chitinivibrionia bacterium]